jgi:YidC/Oxa1 family membrane protein insertase
LLRKALLFNSRKIRTLAEYQNPSQEPGGERRLLLIFLVTFILILATQPLLKKYFPQPPSPSQSQQSGQTQPVPVPTAPASSAAASAVMPKPGATKQASSESETVIENDVYRITFTNKGAQVKSWILKKFKNDTQSAPLDLVNPGAAEKFGYPLSLWTYDETLRNKLNSVLYVASDSPAQAITPPATLTFEYSDADLSVRKTFHFDQTYVVSVETSATSNGSPVSAMPAWPAGFGDQTTPAFYAATFVDYQFNRNIERLPARCGFSIFSKCNSVVGGATLPGPFHWAGATDQYFAAVFIPDNPASATMVTLHNPLALPRDPQKPDANQTVNVDVLGTAVGNLHGTTSERIFVGPKELEVLQKVSIPGVADNDLNGLVDFGFFGIIAKPLFIWLKWTFHHVVANWGWAIVLQTLIISIGLMPFRVYQVHSMYKMQKIAPQMKAIQEKYKKYSMRDPRKQEMQKEIYALQQKEGVNPLAGCLPMLATLPFLYAYYRMLSIALDLRHAHWLWIHDLSAADPYFLLPIFMVVSMLVTQKMTPQAGMDPAQQRMMNVMMPLMMGFIFFRLPAGLNLYYAESNLISIAQQSIMNRTKLGREMRELMAKRARKKDK